MNENTQEYEEWKVDMKKALDNLVAINFERLYLSHDSKRRDIWGEISGELYKKYDLVSISSNDSNYVLKTQMQNCIFINKRIYAEKVFPWELDDSRTYRFVKQYEKLPKQAPKEWNGFEIEQRAEEGRKKREERERFSVFLRQYVAEHPQYAQR